MSFTCPHCGKVTEQPESGEIKFCLHCGRSASAEPDSPGGRERLDRLLRILMTISGGIWLLLFFVPFGATSYEVVMSWDLLADLEGMEHMVTWPLVLSLVYLVLGLVRPLPDWLRACASVLLGFAALVVLTWTGDVRGPFKPDLEFVFMGGPIWVLMFIVVGAALLLRVHAPRSAAARVLLGIGLLFGLTAYLTEAGGESTFVAALLYHLKDSSASQVIGRVLMLLPLFILLVACVAFRGPEEDGDPARRWALVVGLVMLVYLPALLLLYGLFVSVAENSGWFLVMFLRLGLYIAGFFATISLGAAWIADFATRVVLPRVKQQA
ncbi:MAG: hypothetical protein JXR96_06510 [Deltaproteobacteria bacterium]|nr:hypothetical protein [Deltaproteobacteria bacterium]